MKKFILSIFILVAFLLAACGGKTADTAEIENLAAPQVASTSANDDDSGQQPVQPSGEQPAMTEQYVSELTKCLIGLFKLDGTDLALTTDQITALIPILNSYLEQEQTQNQDSAPQQQAATPDTSVLQEQQTALEEQQNALIAQINAVLTADQKNSITSLELDQETVMAFLEEQGIAMGGGQPGQGNGQNMPQGTPSGDQNGNVPQVQGTPANGNGGPGDGRGGNQPGGGGFGSTSRLLIEALLQSLEAKISS